MHTLPIDDVLEELKRHLLHQNRLLLQAPPGAGKTTRIPLALLDQPWMQDKKIIMLEPRRLATKNAALQMARLLGEKVGQRVGYHIRSDKMASAQTKILVVTEGILTRMLHSDPALEEVALVIFDEFHERNLHGDLALALSLESQSLLNESLKIMVMSATLSSNTLSQRLEHPPLVLSQGRSFDVALHYLKAQERPLLAKDIVSLTLKTIQHCLQNHTGSLLVFLPGAKEIRAVEKRLLTSATPELIIAPLYGMLEKKAQERAIAATPKNQRKIVLATNIAESSLTIEGITVVIDSGFERLNSFSSDSGMNTLLTQRITQDSAIQRAGRAGRLSEGSCYRLWHENTPLKKHTQAEILRSDLTPMVLELCAWGMKDISEGIWLDLPSEHNIIYAQTLLQQLDAIDTNLNITPHGEEILKLGLHPRMAHMILKAKAVQLTYTATLISALLEERELLKGMHIGADLTLRLEALKESSASVDRQAQSLILQSAQTYFQRSGVQEEKRTIVPEMCGLLLAFAYPDRIAQARDLVHGRYLLSGSKGARLHQDDSLIKTPYLVVARLSAQEADAQIYSAAPITLHDLQKYFSHHISEEVSAQVNLKEQRLEARVIRRLGALVLSSEPTKKVSQQELTQLLLATIKDEGLALLKHSKEAKALQERVTFVNHHQPKTLPRLDESYLLQTLELWLLPYVSDIKSYKSLINLDLYPIFSAMLSFEEHQTLETLAPQKIQVPSGSKIKINYEVVETPTLSVRLQELFGLHQTPLLLNNTVALTITLLSPAHHPMQITKDLKSFWENTYDEVKKELRGKYKKHYWPDDPFDAEATRFTKPRKK